MNKLSSREIRDKWKKYFEMCGHKVLESASLIPDDDNSLLFVNAGVTPLKKYFDGSIIPSCKRLVSIQKCIRTNDIENVGVTKRHLTFFEMMGNFSIGDYFKEEAIEFSYNFLTDDKWMGIDKERIYVTVYPTDNIARDKWISLGLDESHVVPLENNFWEIGEGPCGPDSEIFFDRGSKYDPLNDALDKFKNDMEQERYVEIWNNVFSQYNSKKGVARDFYEELPHKNIDTGAGLERWAVVFQDVDSVFETDLFMPIIKKIEDLTNSTYDGSTPYKVIADHIRAITSALADGACFENQGRGYVLRRLLRRSVRMGKKLGLDKPFIYELVDVVVDIMGDDYPLLKKNKDHVKSLVLEEEELFHKTLVSGERKLNELILASSNNVISGEDAFKLYDTYGFPFELTVEYLNEEGFSVSKEEFDKCMMEAKKLSKSSYKQESSMNIQNASLLSFDKESIFTYDDEVVSAKIIAIFDGEEFVDIAKDGDYVIFDKTCFYATSGGQVNDIGVALGCDSSFDVVDVSKMPNGAHLHKLSNLKGEVKVGDVLTLKIDSLRRSKIRVNHSSIHIIQKVLQDLLDSSIHQKGSYVSEDRFRFDFVYKGKISDDDILKVEKEANCRINNNIDTVISYMKLEEARKMGAMALFTEKYKDIVRVVTIGSSIELCGGTHIRNTNEIKRMAIINLESKGANVYRIEGVTNDSVLDGLKQVCTNYIKEEDKLMGKLNALVEGINSLSGIKEEVSGLKEVVYDSYEAIINFKYNLDMLQKMIKEKDKKYNNLKLSVNKEDISKYLNNVITINNNKVIVSVVNDLEMDLLKNTVDNVVNELKDGLVLFINKKDDKINIICSSRCDINAGMVMKKVASYLSGAGGGSKMYACGNGKDISKITSLVDNIKDFIE